MGAARVVAHEPACRGGRRSHDPRRGSAAREDPGFLPGPPALPEAGRAGGVDGEAAWRQPGGRGRGIRVIDVEREWCPAHEDLQIRHFVLDGEPSGDKDERNHGTNVAGVLAGRHGGRGTRGLCPDAAVNGVSIEGGDGRSVATAIHRAASWPGYGDILLLEMQAPARTADLTSDRQAGWLRAPPPTTGRARRPRRAPGRRARRPSEPSDSDGGSASLR